MSEPIPESVPTSQDPRSKRPIKKRALTPNGQQAADVEALFARPDREIVFPDPTFQKKRQLPPPPEIVQNVQGSSAGAGSGEFHVYKASRRREYERLRMMDEESKQEKDTAEFKQEREERLRKDEEKTRKNREKRDKAKKRKLKSKNENGSDKSGPEPNGVFFKKGPMKITSADGDEADGRDRTAKQLDSNGSVDSEEVGITIHDDD